MTETIDRRQGATLQAVPAPKNPMDLFDGRTVTTSYVNLDGETAYVWLAEHLDEEKNRPLNKDRVARYAADMRAGRWQLTHQGLAISADGVLVDGQHRLHAIFEADVTVPIQVTVGIRQEAFATIDTGGARTIADIAHVAGHGAYRTLTPAIGRILHFHREGHYDVPAPVNTSITQAAILQICEELGWEKLQEAAEAMNPAPKGFSRAAFGAFYYLAVNDRKIDQQLLMDSFLTPIFSGAGLPHAQDPRLVLRNRMAKERFTGYKSRQRLLGAIVRTWNNHLQGAHTRNLVMPNAMPEIDLPNAEFLGRFYTGRPS